MQRGAYTLNELTDLAGVSTRTVRYYISEGLLPPPESAGPRATYSQTHLDRLLFIGQLKDAYLPLREIRRQLDGMTDQEVREAIDTPSEVVSPSHSIQEVDDARRYLRDVMTRIDRSEFHDIEDSTKPAAASPGFYQGSALSRFRGRAESNEPVSLGVHASKQPDDHGTTWRRIELGPDAELLIRDEAYDRNRDRIDWLINWAKRVFR